MTGEFEDSANPVGLGGVPSALAKEPVLYTRADFTLFHAVETLTHKLGVTREHLRRVVLKELVDNALDVGANVSIDVIGSNNPDDDSKTVRISDDGPGIPGTAEEIAHLADDAGG